MLRLNSKEIDDMVKKSGRAVSAKIRYPLSPGPSRSWCRARSLPKETIDFMRKLDVKEIHGYQASLGPGN